MALKCFKCGKTMQFYENFKIVNNDKYCDACFLDMEENKHFSLRIKKFLMVNSHKVYITTLIYLSMLFYNIILFKPLLNESDSFFEWLAQLGFVINFPILILANKFRIDSMLISIILSVASVLIVFYINYFLACTLYHIYKSAVAKTKT
jgi:hypothetical protein